MSFNNISFNTKGDKGTSTPAEDSVTGTGGSVMRIYSEDREKQLETAVSGTYTNESEYSFPAGIVNTGGYSSFKNSEKNVGVSATGVAVDNNGDPMPGVVSIESGGYVRSETAISGAFIAAAPPPDGAYKGSAEGGGTYNFRFTPSFSALDYYEENIGVRFDAGRIQYGSVSGKVTNIDGEPVEGDKVVGEGMVTKTDENGDYSLQAPGGATVKLTAVGQTVERTPSAGETLVVDFQYGRLEVEVVTPDLDPIKGMKVRIGSNTYTTDDNGMVVIENAPVSAYEILVSDYLLINTQIQQQGELLEERIGTDNKSGVRLELVDKETGELIKNIPATFEGKGLRSISDKQGELALFTDEAGDITLSVGKSDRRYKTEEYEMEMSIGDTVADSIEMERKKQVSGQ